MSITKTLSTEGLKSAVRHLMSFRSFQLFWSSRKDASSQMNNGKSHGKKGIEAELLLQGGDTMVNLLFQSVFGKGAVP